ncbi:MAG: dethiobiotin synthase [Betaproteobacteria bacterium]|nr:dethiobiotin synthase [Betaproteobacteria bacterium]
MSHFFITGTDTGVGKTVVTAGLVRALQVGGRRCVGMKPVAAGCELKDGVWRNEDVDQLLAAANVAVSADDINVYPLRAAIAPHIAAAQEGVAIDLANIRKAFAALTERADAVLVEGVGGFVVPLNDDADTADLAHELALPVILVVGLRLGCLNHALLTAEAIRARGLTLAGWVGNSIDATMPARDENIAALHARLAAPCLGIVHWTAAATNPAIIATFLNPTSLLQGP